MRLPIFALLARSLRVESRALSTYGLRLGLVLIIFFVLMMAHASSLRLSAAGLFFFSPIVYINFIFVSVAGLGYFSSAITEEKEEETLGLLKMSNLNPVSILLGKSTSRLVGAVFLFLAQFPFTLLAVTLGGVSVTQVIAVYATLLAYIVFLANLALFSSVCCQRTTSAAGMTFLLGVLFLIVGPIGVALVPQLAAPYPTGWLSGKEWYYRAVLWTVTRLYEANPLVRLGQILRVGFAEHPVSFQVVSNLVLGAAFFGLSWASFGFFTREQKTAAPARGVLFKRSSPMRWLGIGRPWPIALAWKDFHFMAGGRTMIVGKLIGMALLTFVIAYLMYLGERRLPSAKEIGSILMVGALCVAGLDCVLHAGRVFHDEVKWGTLPDIAQLPVSTRMLVYHKALGYIPALVPYGVAFFVGLLLHPRAFDEGARELFREPAGWASICQFVAFVHFVAYMSLLLKRFGIVAALFAWIIGYSFLSGLLFLMFRPTTPHGVDAIQVVLCIGLAAFAVLMHALIIARLQKLAGQ